MVPIQNCEIFVSVIFFVLSKLLCFVYTYQMHKKRLSSIPEKNETEEETKVTKWVPKKKHEVLKAKYKCLKKLFQIYDASVIGILPDPYSNEEFVEERPKRKRRSHRTKTDTGAGTHEVSSGDFTEIEDKSVVANTMLRDLNMQCSSTQVMSAKSETTRFTKSETTTKFKDGTTQGSKETLNFSERSDRSDRTKRTDRSEQSASEGECECTQTPGNIHNQHPVPYLMLSEKRKLTRFQSFIHRIFGIRPEKTYRDFVMPNGHVYAASDNNITQHYSGRRRRRLRFRRLRKAKKVHSDSGLRDFRSQAILSFVQSVQKNCLMDTTPRQCPIMGCRMMSYGIINYNDHLNLCHFTDRKFICHYCHEGFILEYDKYFHENEHIGITKLNLNYSDTSTGRPSTKRASITQTDPQLNVPEDKLKKIVSFFDKMVDNEHMLSEIKKKRYSESNLQMLQRSRGAELECSMENSNEDSSMNGSCDQRTMSCHNLPHRRQDKSKTNTADSDGTSKFPCTVVKCHFCGENFDHRRQLSLHVDLEHGIHDKFSKFHSCAGITSPLKMPSNHCVTTAAADEGKLKLHTMKTELRRVNTSSTLTQETFEVARRKSDETLSYDPSTNIIFFESLESVKKPSVIDSLVQKVRSYKWEPGTKIIRV